ncbi:MAG: tRNA (guanosine(37)-N1)-methyltransferase TrmD [Bacilli bacterium]|nr:tRNA (guanosine(37)-N1)-methyltransferase TrmD [Bacilli bacterium]
MRIQVLTLFPAMFEGFQTNSIIARAIGKGVVDFSAVQIRDYTKDKYGRTDTPPIGGGAGLVQKAQPIVDCIKANKKEGTHVILMSPRGATFNQNMAKKFAKLDDLMIVCGHYEGVDERVNDYIDELVSIGDYVLTGGEIPAMAIADSVIRLLDGAITRESLDEESFDNNTLEYPQYTEPFDFEGKTVPAILYSGNHGAIAKWRRKQSLLLTRKYRPDLFDKLTLSKADLKLLEEADSGIVPKWEADAIEKGKKFMH